jgi:hypothetical protein
MKKIVFVIALSFLFLKGFAQDDKFKALYLYNITTFIEWPSLGENFIITSLGESSVIANFQSTHGSKTINSKTIIVHKAASVDNIGNCQILFIPSEQSGQLAAALAKLSGKATLIVTDKEGLAKQGSCINYINVGGKLNLEINRRNIETRGLKVDSQLLLLGIEIK